MSFQGQQCHGHIDTQCRLTPRCKFPKLERKLIRHDSPSNQPAVLQKTSTLLHYIGVHKSPDLLFHNHCSFITAALRTVNQQLGLRWVAGKGRNKHHHIHTGALVGILYTHKYTPPPQDEIYANRKKDVRLCGSRFRDHYSGCTDLNKIVETRLPRRNRHASVRSCVSNLT